MVGVIKEFRTTKKQKHTDICRTQDSKIPTVFSKFKKYETWDLVNTDQLVKTILKKYNIDNVPINRKISVRTISTRSWQREVLRTTLWKNEKGELYIETKEERPLY
jgi:hypothetical protein